MDSRMNKYNKNDELPTRSDKNKELYKQVYEAYDEFENLDVPSNSREIDLTDLKREVTGREEYREMKEVGDITNNRVVRKERVLEEQKKENEIYDINELLNKAVLEKKKPELIEPKLANGDYLKKLKLDSNKTNIEQVKEIYDDIKEESMIEDESLLKTANLSLEILSDLKSDNDATMISAPIKDEENPYKSNEADFYSNTYKFSKTDFYNKDYEENFYDDDEKSLEDGNGKFFFKIVLLIFGLLLVVLVLLYLVNYFNRA